MRAGCASMGEEGEREAAVTGTSSEPVNVAATRRVLRRLSLALGLEPRCERSCASLRAKRASAMLPLPARA